MQTKYFDEAQLERAGEMLAKGKLVAFPTETVYGLGANALDQLAVDRIFLAKGRPSDNPLIVHIARVKQVDELAQNISPSARRLIGVFWPGPLTIVLSKREIVPNNVTAGLSTVAIRLPAHPWAHRILRSANVPVAAPSANRSGSPSATTWQAVRQDLDGRIDAVVCGPNCEVGLESTVVDASSSEVRILRPGTVTQEQLQSVCPSVLDYEPHRPIEDIEESNSPGLRHRHYQPKARVVVGELPHSVNGTAWYIGLSLPNEPLRYQKVERCSSAVQYAQRLYQFFREADDANISVVCCAPLVESGLGQAIMDRVRRASGQQAIT